jgi:predicted nucleic acid-binding protein
VSDPFVADSSVGVAWSVVSQANALTERLKTDVYEGRAFIVPSLWLLEVANTLLVLTRRAILNVRQRQRACEGLTLMSPVIDDQASALAFGRILTLGDEHGLGVYDATYLELALRRGLPLASRDARLNKAAKRCGIKTLL